MKVLVVDNNHLIIQQLCDLLQAEGYETIQATDGQTALKLYRETRPDFICLDIVMDDISGYDICREIRAADKNTPIVFISSKSQVFEKVAGLDIGADDYITKPFDLFEVKARIRSVARRCLSRAEGAAEAEAFTLSGLRVFPAKLRAEKDGKTIELSLREVKILQLFAKNNGNVITRDALLDHCWGEHITPESRTVDWHISQLRKKIEDDPENPGILKTVHGAGYKFENSST